VIERAGNRFGKASKKQAGNDDPEEGVRKRTAAAGERKAVSSCRPHREQVTDVFWSVESPWSKGLRRGAKEKTLVVPGATLRPSMPAGGQAEPRVTWNHFFCAHITPVGTQQACAHAPTFR